MSEKTTKATNKVVKRIREMSDAELNQLPKLKADLVKSVFKKSGQVNHSMVVHIAKDFDEVIPLTQEQYATIKLLRNVEYDKQEITVFARISKGSHVEGQTFMLLEVVAARDVYFNVLLSKLRIRQIEILTQQGKWIESLNIEEYPDKVDAIVDTTIVQ